MAMLLRPLLAADAAPPAEPTAALPVDVRAMNAVASTVFVIAGVVLLAAAAAWIARRPYFALRAIDLAGDLQRNSVTTVRANAMPHLAGGYFTVDLEQARAAFQQVPWVRRAVVQRIWPDRLQVTLEEHQPVALWAGDENSDTMVNSHGEVFEANVGDVEDDGLPEFEGPAGSSAQVYAMYLRLQPLLKPLETEIASIRLSGRGSWRIELDSGAVVELGRGTEEDVVARTQRFVRTVQQVLDRFHAPLQSADLRHAEGYAVRLKGASVAAEPSSASQRAPARPAREH